MTPILKQQIEALPEAIQGFYNAAVYANRGDYLDFWEKNWSPEERAEYWPQLHFHTRCCLLKAMAERRDRQQCKRRD